jgi:IgGFc binding protein
LNRDVAQPRPTTSHTATVAVVVACVLALGCSGGGPSTIADGGPSDGPDDGASSVDASPEARPLVCHLARVCDGSKIRVCVDGQPGDVVDECTGLEVCSLGRCTSALCQVAEMDRSSFIGCFFPLFQPENVFGDEDQPTSVLIANASSTVASVSIERRVQTDDNVPPVWQPLASQLSVPPKQAGRFTVTGAQLRGAALRPIAIRVFSTAPITVLVVHSDDRAPEKTTSSGGTMVLPMQALGQHYRVMTYPQLLTPDVLEVGGGQNGAGRFAVVATQPGTVITLQLPPGATALAGLDTGTIDSRGPVVIPLNDEGMVIHVRSDTEGVDLSRTDIKANFPVAVFSGNITTAYGRIAPGPYTPDMAHEQMPPVRAWSKSYLAAELPPQAGVCGSLLNPDAEPGSTAIWRIIAAEDETLVSFAAPPSVLGLPPSPIVLNRTDVAELVVTGGSFEVTGTKPVLVTQGIDCEPSLSLAVPTEHQLGEFPFAVLPNFDHLLAVVRLPGALVSLDDVALSSDKFTRVGGFEIAQISIDSCPFTSLACPHRLSGAFGATLRGMDVLASFALTPITSKGCADPSDLTCVD